MSKQKREGPGIVESLLLRVGQNASSTGISDVVAHILDEAALALTPILGREGVAALFKRSLFLAGSKYAWITLSPQGKDRSIDLDVLKALITAQTPQEATSGSTALLFEFYGLLTSLIGSSLTDRILESAWIDLSSGKTAQDHSL